MMAVASPQARAARQANDVEAGERLQSWVLLIGFFLITNMARAVYGAHGAGLSHRFIVIEALGFTSLAWYWLRCHTRSRQIGMPMDMGMWLVPFWILIVPYYVLRVEGKSGLLTLGILFGAYGLLYAVGFVLGLLLA